jgi:hypothetical protein
MLRRHIRIAVTLVVLAALGWLASSTLASGRGGHGQGDVFVPAR